MNTYAYTYLQTHMHRVILTCYEDIHMNTYVRKVIYAYTYVPTHMYMRIHTYKHTCTELYVTSFKPTQLSTLVTQGGHFWTVVGDL